MIQLGVVIGELYGRNGELALIARHSQEVIDHVAFHAIGCEFGLVCHLGVVLIKVLGEVDDGQLQQFQVARTANDDAQGDGIAGLHRLFVELGRDVEPPHSTREAGRLVRQGIHLNGDSRSDDALLHLHIARTAIEEGLHGVDGAVLLHHDAAVGDGWYLEFTRHLGIHHILAPGDGLIVLASHAFQVEALLLGQWHLLHVEARQIGHLALELGQIDGGIDLIGQQHRFLLVHALLVGADLDEELVAIDRRASLLHGRTVALMVARCTAIGSCGARDGHPSAIGADPTAIHHCLQSRQRIASCLLGIERIGHCER